MPNCIFLNDFSLTGYMKTTVIIFNNCCRFLLKGGGFSEYIKTMYIEGARKASYEP